jgi:hypothetical protein
MSRPDFISWASSRGGMYIHDKKKPTLAVWQPYQVDILKHLFPAGEERLPYSRIIWSEPKKSGKTELAAAVHIYFALFVDVPGEQYSLSNDFDGARARVWKSITGSLEKNPVVKRSDWSQVGSEIRFNNGSMIKAIANDYRGEAGSNHSLATIDEAWGIIHENGLRLMTEFSPVPTRENSTIFYTGYQGFEGISEFYHNLIDSGMAGEPVPELMHIDNGDGKPSCWRNGRTFVFWSHLPRQPWHTPEYLEDQKRSFRGRINEYLRVWENRRTKGADAFCTDDQWDALEDKTLRSLHVDDKRLIVLAADAATKSDSCALVGTTWNETTKKVEQVSCDVWEPEDGTPIKLTETIGPRIVELSQKYKVMAVYYDPFQMAAIAEMCKRAKVEMIEFPQTSRRVESDKHLHDLIIGGNIAHYGDPTLKDHVTNAMAKSQGERGIRIVKELSSKKVDAAVALSMSALGCVETLAGGRSDDMRTAKNPFYQGD